jgi:hypothetical protein
MKSLYIIIIVLCQSISLYSARVYIKNWSSYPLEITEVSVPEKQPDAQTSVPVPPGQSLPLNITTPDASLDNFDAVTVHFTAANRSQTEKFFFPADRAEQTSLSFNDSGYKRYPFNILETLK